MRHLIISALAATALAAAVTPALAQPYDRGSDRHYDRGQDDRDFNGGGINERQDRIEARIEEGERGGGLNRREAFRLRDELRSIERLEQRYRRDGMSGWERSDLERRLDSLSSRVFAERHDGQRRRHW